MMTDFPAVTPRPFPGITADLGPNAPVLTFAARRYHPLLPSFGLTWHEAPPEDVFFLVSVRPWPLRIRISRIVLDDWQGGQWWGDTDGFQNQMVVELPEHLSVTVYEAPTGGERPDCDVGVVSHMVVTEWSGPNLLIHPRWRRGVANGGQPLTVYERLPNAWQQRRLSHPAQPWSAAVWVPRATRNRLPSSDFLYVETGFTLSSATEACT